MNKKILVSLSVITVVAAIAVGGTIAYFSDTETSTGNTFTAGSLDLKIDSQCSYNGVAGDQCGVWGQTNGGEDIVGQKFFSFTDVKPGDSGENTISLHVYNNNAYICASISNLTNADNGCTEPEGDVDNTCNNPGPGEGELQNALVMSIWRDNGAVANSCNNIKDADEDYLVENVNPQEGTWALYDSNTGPLAGDTTTCIGVSWSLPASVENIVQTDSLSGDISFYAEQSRNNENFVCGQEAGPSVIEAEGPTDGWNGGGSLVWQTEGRFGNGATASDQTWELGVGNDTQTASQANTNHVWTSGTSENFTVFYDGNTATFTVGSDSQSYVVGATLNTADLNIIAGKVSASFGDDVELTNLNLNGTPISPSSLIDIDDVDASYLVINSVDLSVGFTLTGTVEFNWTSGTAGSRPDFQVQIRN
ncbi:MAG: TasA family protein [Patescibacteria group bacterium]